MARGMGTGQDEDMGRECNLSSDSSGRGQAVWDLMGCVELPWPHSGPLAGLAEPGTSLLSPGGK